MTTHPTAVRMYLFRVEVMIILSMDVLVAHTNSGTRLVVADNGDAVVPEARADPVIRKPSQNQHLISNLYMSNQILQNVLVAHTNSGTRLVVADNGDAVVPEARADPVIMKPSQNQHLVSNLYINNQILQNVLVAHTNSGTHLVVADNGDAVMLAIMHALL